MLVLAACGDQPAPPAPAPASGSAPSSDEPSDEGVDLPLPTRVQIPAIDVDEPIEGFGLDGDSRLVVPDDPEQVAWFDGGGRPGGPGPTVVYGHVDSTTGPAVFARLGELAAGDVISISTASGESVDYEVVDTMRVPQAEDAFPTEQVFGSTPTDTLRLITCTGLYDPDEGYLDNLIVSAVPR